MRLTMVGELIINRWKEGYVMPQEMASGLGLTVDQLRNEFVKMKAGYNFDVRDGAVSVVRKELAERRKA